MRVLIAFSCATFVSASALALSALSVPAAPPAMVAAPAPAEDGGSPPASLAFEANVGQTDDRVRFVARGPGYTVFLNRDEAVLRLSGGTRGTDDQGERVTRPSPVVRMALAGANPDPEVIGEQAIPRTIHYFTGHDPAKWHRNVPTFGRVRYEDVYPGIDAVYYGNEGQLEFDFVVAPRTDPNRIAMDYAGIDRLRIDDAGRLVLRVGEGELVQHRPIAYQLVGGARRIVEASYRLLGDRSVGFVLGTFDRGLPLVIDPILTYSTYLGGTGSEAAQAITVDSVGNSWVTGVTDSVAFPGFTAAEETYGGGDGDAFVCRFAANGGLPACAYIGGEGWDEGYAIGTDALGRVYVAGYTESTAFPVVNASQRFPRFTARPGGGVYGDAFVLEINEQFDGLEWSTYYGGMGLDVIRAMAVDLVGNVFVTGETWATQGFPTTSDAVQARNPNGRDAFVARFTGGGWLSYSTFLGGGGSDAGRGIAVDEVGRMYVAGHTTSSNFPGRSPIKGSYKGNGDAFLVRLRDEGARIDFSMYLGGTGEDWAYDVKLNAAGRVLVAGVTTSTDLPVVSPLQSFNAGEQDAFVAVVTIGVGTKVNALTYLGGSGFDDLRHLAVDPAGDIHLAGYTRSLDFPTKHSLQARAAQDAVLVELNPTATALLSSTPLGGADYEVLSGLAVGRDGTTHVTGWTASVDFPLARAFQSVHANQAPDGATASASDAFVTRVGDPALDSWRGDFDLDGRDDVLWHNIATGEGFVWPSAIAAKAYRTPPHSNLGYNPDERVVGIGDFNGDGADDILWRSLLPAPQMSISRAVKAPSGDGTWEYEWTFFFDKVIDNMSLDWRVAGTGDFDADGYDDILWHRDDTGESLIWLKPYNDGGVVKRISRVLNLAWDIVGVGDFNGDGKADILWRDTSEGKMVIWKGGNSGSQLGARNVHVSWQVVAIADFRNDGGDDIVWWNVESGHNSLWDDGLYGERRSLARTVQTMQLQSAGDYEGDGRADMLWRDNVTGKNVIWRNGQSSTRRPISPMPDLNWTPKS